MQEKQFIDSHPMTKENLTCGLDPCQGHQNRYEWEKVKRGCYHAGGISSPTDSENNTINLCCC